MWGMFEGRGPADHRLRGSREPTLLKPDPLRFGSLLLLFINLTQGDFIGRRPPPDWHVVKSMGHFLDY